MSSTSGLLNMCLMGAEPETASETVDLYMAGCPSGTDSIYNTFPMYVLCDPFSSQINAYVHGEAPPLSASLNLTISGSGTYSCNTVDMFITGSDNAVPYGFHATSQVDAYLYGDPGVTSGCMNLYLQQNSSGITNNLTVFLHGHAALNEDVNLYTMGISGVATSGMDCFIHGVGAAESNTTLFTRGYNDSYSSTLYMRNITLAQLNLLRLSDLNYLGL